MDPARSPLRLRLANPQIPSTGHCRFSRNAALRAWSEGAHVTDQVFRKPVLGGAFAACLVVDQRRHGYGAPREVPEIGVEAGDVAAVAPDFFAGKLIASDAEPVLGRLERFHPVGHRAARCSAEKVPAVPSTLEATCAWASGNLLASPEDLARAGDKLFRGT